MKHLLLAVLLAAAAALACTPFVTPTGLHVYKSPNGCTSDGQCPFGGPANFYWAPTREIVLVPGQPLKVAAHETCHGHQHQVILNETGAEPQPGGPPPSAVDLHEWLTTTEAAAYLPVVAAADGGFPAWGRRDTALWLLEDFAEACGRFLAADPRFPLDPGRAAFFEGMGMRRGSAILLVP